MVVPFRVGYRQPAEGAWYVVDLLIDIYFYVDVVLNFHTGYVDPDDEERVIYEPWAIARKYARTWLSIDIVACLPIDLVIRVSEGRLLCSMAAGGCAEDESGASDSSGQLLRLFKLLRLFRLMKLLRLARITRLFERYQDDLFEYLHFFAVLKLIVVMLYVGHLFGCFFHYFSVDEWRTDDELAQIDAGTLSPWLKEYFDDSHHASGDVWDRYIASMYWAFTTMTTVGYGDITPANNLERVYSCFALLTGALVFGYMLSSIGSLVAATLKSMRAAARKDVCDRGEALASGVFRRVNGGARRLADVPDARRIPVAPPLDERARQPRVALVRAPAEPLPAQNVVQNVVPVVAVAKHGGHLAAPARARAEEVQESHRVRRDAAELLGAYHLVPDPDRGVQVAGHRARL